MIMADYKKYNTDGRSSEDRALDKFAEMMIEKINTLQNDWKKPWFTEGSLTWPKNLSGREYNGMNALMLMMHCEKQGYKLPVFCTFDRVAGLNFNKDKQGKRQHMVTMPTTAFRRMRLSFLRNASSRMESPSTPISDMRWLTLRVQRTIWAD